MKPHLVILQGLIPSYRKPLFNALAAKYQVTVIHGGAPSTIESDQFKELVLPTKKFGPFKWFRRLPNEISPEPIAVVSMFDLRWPQLVFRRLAPKGQKFLLWGHRYSRHAVVNFMRDQLMHRADGMILYGTEDLQRMLDRGHNPKKISIAPNTIEVSNHQDCSSHSKNSFIYVGRLQTRKRLSFIIESFADAYPKLPQNTKFNIVGDGAIREELMSLARERMPSGQIQFHGALTTPEDLFPLFSSAFAYISDNVGLGLLHSFAYGVPVVTFKHTHQSETDFRHGPEVANLIHEQNGVWLDKDAELENVMIRLSKDRSYARSLGENAYTLYDTSMRLEDMVAGFQKLILGR